MLSELVDYYNYLVNSGKEGIARFGWCTSEVSYVARIDSEGGLASVIPLSHMSVKHVVVPSRLRKSSDITANFLCDNSAYLFGIDKNGNSARAAKCLEASRELYHKVLDGVDSACAKTLLGFFDKWDSSGALEHPAIAPVWDGLKNSAWIIFEVETDCDVVEPLKDVDTRHAWESYYSSDSPDTAYMRCLVTGEVAAVEKTHPTIKGVGGAKSLDKRLVSFNKHAFESYGHYDEQGRNAPVSRVSAHAYATALNYLLANPDHHVQLGDTTIVYWSDKQDGQNCSLLSLCMGAWSTDENTKEDTDALVDATFKAIRAGEYVDLADIDLDANFFVLGIAPSSTRLVVRFFLRNSFGSILQNIGRHYNRADIVTAPHVSFHPTPKNLLNELKRAKRNERNTEEKNSDTHSLIGPLMKAILNDTRYPQALYDQCIARIHAAQVDPDRHIYKVTAGRAAIIRAFLIRNHSADGYGEKGLTVALNYDRDEVAYNLGRTFAVLEDIQRSANKKVTIANRYFNAASTTPESVYPQMLRLAKVHIEKIRRGPNAGLAHYFESLLADVLQEERVGFFPKRLNGQQQGDFMLGYYHQIHNRPISEKNSESEGE